MSVDLDINNYNLKDILSLFKIPVDFDESDMKRAKLIVLKTHPDKSRLSPDYFLFYSKAYKMLHSVWEFRKKGDINTPISDKNTDYTNTNEEEKRGLLDNFFSSKEQDFKNNKVFNNWFNEQFEKNKLHSETEEKGYQNWLKDDDIDADAPKNVTMATMGAEFEKKKREARALIVRDDIQDFSYSGNATDLSNEAPSSFDSDMFSSLPYQDLYQAHTTSVIPVTEEDYNSKQKFNNVNEFVSYRNSQDTKPLSEQQALQYLNGRTKTDEKSSVKRAYDLAKQSELAKQNSQAFWAGIQLLHNR